MNRKAAISLLAALLPAVGLLAGTSDEQSLPNQKGKESLVTVYVNVERKGKPVSGLGAGNFRVYENGQPGAVQVAVPAEPASVVLLVENSRLSWYFLNDHHMAMRGFLKAATPAHTYALVSYARNAKVEIPMTDQIRDIGSAYSKMSQSAWARTDTYDAVYRILGEMQKLSGRKALIVIGSGFDSFSKQTFGEVQQKAEETGATIFTIATGSGLRRQDGSPFPETSNLDPQVGEMFMNMLADTSGGLCFCPSCEAEYSSSMQEVLEAIENQYAVSYARPAPMSTGFVKLKVEAFRLHDDVRRDFKVRARSGWRQRDRQ